MNRSVSRLTSPAGSWRLMSWCTSTCQVQSEHNKAGEAKQHAVVQEFAKIMGEPTTNAHARFFTDECYGNVTINWGGDW